jgi:hypothetical protein
MLFDGKTKVARVNDSYAIKKHFGCLLDPEAFVESDVSYIHNLLFYLCIDENYKCLVCVLMKVMDVYINCIEAQTNLKSRDGRDVYLETFFNSEMHLKYGQYKDNHSEEDRNNDPVVERVSKYIEHDLVSVIFIRKNIKYISST